MKPVIKTYYLFIKKEIARELSREISRSGVVREPNILVVNERDMPRYEGVIAGVYTSKENASKNAFEHEGCVLYQFTLDNDNESNAAIIKAIEKNKSDDLIPLPHEFFTRFHRFTKAYLTSKPSAPEASSSAIIDNDIKADIDGLMQLVSDRGARDILVQNDQGVIRPLINDKDKSIRTLAKLKIYVLTKDSADSDYAETIKSYLLKIRGKESVPGMFSSRDKKIWEVANQLLKKHFPDSPIAAPSSSSS